MFNLLVEKEIAGNVIGVGFVGEPVRNLGRVIGNFNSNVPTLGPGGCGATTAVGFGNPCLPLASSLPLVGSVQVLETNGVSNYTALQLTFQRRFSKGLTFASNYTLANSLSDVGGPGGACTACAQVLNDFGRDYGPSDFMVKHRFTFTGNYELPFGKNMKGIAGQAVKGWQVNAIYAYATGTPFTVQDGVSQQNSFGVVQDRPSLVAPSAFTQSTGEWFDITQFRKQPFGTAGNEGHNAFFLPRNVRLDLSLFKDFRITEGTKLQFRAEAFNITNTPLYAFSPGNNVPNSTISAFDSNGVPTSAGNFGKLTAMNAFYTPRDIQFALKLIF
jgi:hypothetical protein